MNLERIIKGTDKYIKPMENDTIFITEPMYLGVEKRMVQIMDDIAKANMNVISLNGKVHLLEHPSREDLMLMINLMQPKYYFPVKGEYKDQYANADIANQTGIRKENIICIRLINPINGTFEIWQILAPNNAENILTEAFIDVLRNVFNAGETGEQS